MNSLIAEFMRRDECYLGMSEERAKRIFKYHTSWDWLIPVVDKCFQEEGKHYVINDALLTINIDEVYDAVVNFIRENTDTEKMMKMRIADMDSDLN